MNEMEKTKTVTDFTQGKVKSIILKFYFPLLITSMLQQFYSFADTAIVGKGLGDNSLAAVGNMASLCFLIVGFSMGLSNGFSILIAQKYGEKDYVGLRKMLAGSVSLAAILTVILTVFSTLFLRPVLGLLRTDSSIIGESLIYGHILFGGLFATISYNTSAGILRSLGDSKTPLKAIIMSSILNICLDLFFIFVLHSGVWGAAAATIFSQIVSAFVCIKKIREIDMLRLKRNDFRNVTKTYGILLKNSIPMALMNSITAIGCMVVQYFVNGIGVAAASAYSACSKYINMFMMPACTAGQTMSAYTSQNYGAKRFDRIKEGLFVCLGIAAVSYILLGLPMFFFPRFLASILLNGEQPLRYASQFLPITGIMIFAVDFLFVFRSGVQGMGFPLIPMCSGITEMVLRISAISILISSLGFRATAVAEVCAWVGAGSINALAFFATFVRKKKLHENKESTKSGAFLNNKPARI